jgi:TetR/AcrR family transcriptional repressor of nem operon
METDKGLSHRPQRRSSCETRQTLLEVTLRLMSKHSFAAVSVDDICRTAHVKKGSFYHFFSSKSELAVAAINEYSSCSRPGLDSAFSPTKPPLQRLKDFCTVNVLDQNKKLESLGRVCGCPLITLGSEFSEESDEVRCAASALGALLVKYFETTIADGVREGDIPLCDPRKMAEQLHTVMIGAATKARIQNNLEPVNELWPMMASLLRLPESHP